MADTQQTPVFDESGLQVGPSERMNLWMMPGVSRLNVFHAPVRLLFRYRDDEFHQRESTLYFHRDPENSRLRSRGSSRAT